MRSSKEFNIFSKLNNIFRWFEISSPASVKPLVSLCSWGKINMLVANLCVIFPFSFFIWRILKKSFFLVFILFQLKIWKFEKQKMQKNVLLVCVISSMVFIHGKCFWYVAPYMLRRMICKVKIFSILLKACIIIRRKRFIWLIHQKVFLRVFKSNVCATHDKSFMNVYGCALSSMVGNPGVAF